MDEFGAHNMSWDVDECLWKCDTSIDYYDDYFVDPLSGTYFDSIGVKTGDIEGYFRCLYYFMDQHNTLPVSKISKKADVYIAKAHKYVKSVRQFCHDYLHVNWSKIGGLYGGILEYDGFYHKNKHRIDKYVKKQKIPRWFRGLVLHNFTCRDFNQYGRHTTITMIVRGKFFFFM